MPIVLTRIDDRLIHGQVVEGWLRVIQADRILVVSDQAASDPLQISLMQLAVPTDVQVIVMPVASAAPMLREDKWEKNRVLLLLPNVHEARLLLEAGVVFDSINLGGMHDAPGRVSYTPSLALTVQERKDVDAILQRGVFIETRCLPADEKRDVRDLLNHRAGSPVKDVRPQ